MTAKNPTKRADAALATLAEQVAKAKADKVAKTEAAKVAKAEAANARKAEQAAKAATEAAKADAKARAEADKARIARAADTYGQALVAADATLADAARAVALAILETGLKVTAEAMGATAGDKLPATAANYASRLNAIAAAHAAPESHADARKVLAAATTQSGVFKACEAIRDALGAKGPTGRKAGTVAQLKPTNKAPTQQGGTQEAAKVEADAAHEAAGAQAVADSGNAEAVIALCNEALAAFHAIGEGAGRLGDKALRGILADAQARVIRHRDAIKVASI